MSSTALPPPNCSECSQLRCLLSTTYSLLSTTPSPHSYTASSNPHCLYALNYTAFALNYTASSKPHCLCSQLHCLYTQLHCPYQIYCLLSTTAPPLSHTAFSQPHCLLCHSVWFQLDTVSSLSFNWTRFSTGHRSLDFISYLWTLCLICRPYLLSVDC